MGLIENGDAGTFIKDGLLTVSTKCQDQRSVVIFKLAKLVQQPNWSGNLGISPTHPPAGILGIGQTLASLLVFPGIIRVFADIIGRLLFSLFKAIIPESGAVEDDNMFAGAELDEEEESRLPLHTAIKFGFKNDLKELLERRDKVDVNQLDSKERTAADFAALCGEEDLLELIKSRGGKFHVKSLARMKAIARKQAPYAMERLNSILEAL